MNNKDKIPGGLSDNWSAEDIAKKHGVNIKQIEKELKKGVNVEFEHTNKKERAREIALDHLYEFPDYYTRLEDMENEAKKEMNEGNKNITDYAKRMRELAGLSESNQKKTIKTIQEGNSSFEEGAIFTAADLMSSNDKKDDAASDAASDAVNEAETEAINESEVTIQGFNKEPGDLMGSAEERGEEFDTHKFEQKTIEEGENDEELYNLNENSIIVLDFINEEVAIDERKMAKDMIDKALAELGVNPNEPMAKNNVMYSKGLDAVEFMIQMNDTMKAEQEAESTASKISDWI